MMSARRQALALAVGALVLGCVAWAGFSTFAGLASVAGWVAGAWWVLGFTIPLHLGQLLISSRAWQGLFVNRRPDLAQAFRLRLMREAIDSLLPVAQIGGELFAARRLVRDGMAGAAAGASVVVDLTLEVLSQAIFLAAGLAALGSARDGAWLGSLVLVLAAGGAFLVAQRLGGLRLLEWLVDRLGGLFPALASLSLTGLHDAAQAIYRRPAPVVRGLLLHLLAWSLGTVETWLVLRAIGQPTAWLAALIVESLGMAARSAGFAVPGALAVQEGGFILAGAAVGLPSEVGLALSLLKRARELLVGIAGLALTRVAPRTPVTAPHV